MNDGKKSIFSINKIDKYRTINDLIEESRENGTYYTLLILSSIIIASGVLLANSAILIGGMLVTPVLTPVLLIALGIVASRPQLLKRTSILILKSVLVILAISFISGLLFSTPENTDFYKNVLFDNSLRAAFLYFLVAFASGIAATFAWVRKETTNILPGISIAVSLVPPLSMVAIWLSVGEGALMRFFFFVFLFNMIGIIMGGMIVFSLMRFAESEKTIDKKVAQVIEEEKKIKAEKSDPTNISEEIL